MQTASATAKLLKINEICVNFNLSKWLRIKKRKYLSENVDAGCEHAHPLEKLLILQTDRYPQDKKYPPGPKV